MFSVKDIESGIIFEKCTIQEITDVERKLRQDIEKKKEDLREMVGERYRELIEAADTITDMKNGTERVASSITHLQDLCQSLKQSSVNFHKLSISNVPKSLTSLPRRQLDKFNQAVCMKIFMDIPNKIWSCLDKEEYLNATRLYLLSHHLHSSMRSGMNEHTSKLNNIALRQWTTFSHLRASIVKGVTAKLKDAKLSEKMTSECMCSIILLQEISMEEIFKTFLKSREEVIQQHFESCGIDETVKPLLCDIIRTVIVTLRQVQELFVRKDEGQGQGYLMSMLQEALDSDNSNFFGQDGFGLSEVAMKYLPKHVLDFKPLLKVQPKPVEGKFMAQNCSEFMESSSKCFGTGVEALLNFVTTVKALTDIRDAVYQLIKENVEICNWQSLCNDIMGKGVDIWNDLLREHFLSRLKLLLQSHMDALLLATKSQVIKMLEDLADENNKLLKSERNLSNNVWSESANDIPQNAVWTPINQKSNHREGGLYMKARGFTPGVQSLCLSIDANVKILLDDVMNYVAPITLRSAYASNSYADQENIQSSSTSLTFSGSFSSDSASSCLYLEDPFCDKKHVRDLLRSTCISFLNNLLKFLRSQLLIYKEEITMKKTMDCTSNGFVPTTLQRVLYMARISNGICNLSPSLQKCMIISDESHTEFVPMLRSWKATKTPLLGTPNKIFIDNDSWLEIVNEMDKFSQEVYMLWSDHVVVSLTEVFKKGLFHRKDNAYSAFISSCTQWDATIIEEENEEGNFVKSVIKVPMQASWFVQDMLCKLCVNINKVGGHVIPSSIIHNLTVKLLGNVLLMYHNMLSLPTPPLYQSRALQMWFDVKYLIGMLSPNKEEHPESKWENTSKEVLELLECHVDPFDLDVFRPHLKKHLNKLFQRSNTLYGLVLTSEKSSFSSVLPSTSGQEQHHIMPLTTGINRFPLLPLPQQAKQITIDSSIKTSQAAFEATNYGESNKVLNASIFQASLPHREQSPVPPTRAGSSSFLEQMSTLFSSSPAATLYIK